MPARVAARLRVVRRQDLERRLLDWYETGYLAVDGLVFGVGAGVQTGRALQAQRCSMPALAASG